MALPAEVRTALSGVAAALRDVPRDCIVDKAELFHWLRRVARRVDDIRDRPMPAPTASKAPPRAPSTPPALPSPPRMLSARERAEAAFRCAGDPSTPTSALSSPRATAEPIFVSSGGAPPRPRIVMDRKGRGVRVEVRRARAAGQMEMFGQS